MKKPNALTSELKDQVYQTEHCMIVDAQANLSQKRKHSF